MCCRTCNTYGHVRPFFGMILEEYSLYAGPHGLSKLLSQLLWSVAFEGLKCRALS